MSQRSLGYVYYGRTWSPSRRGIGRQPFRSRRSTQSHGQCYYLSKLRGCLRVLAADLTPLVHGIGKTVRGIACLRGIYPTTIHYFVGHEKTSRSQCARLDKDIDLDAAGIVESFRGILKAPACLLAFILSISTTERGLDVQEQETFLSWQFPAPRRDG